MRKVKLAELGRIFCMGSGSGGGGDDDMPVPPPPPTPPPPPPSKTDADVSQERQDALQKKRFRKGREKTLLAQTGEEGKTAKKKLLGA